MILPFQILLHPFSLNCLRFARYYLRLKRNSTPGETFTNLRAKAEGAEKLITAVYDFYLPRCQSRFKSRIMESETMQGGVKNVWRRDLCKKMSTNFDRFQLLKYLNIFNNKSSTSRNCANKRIPRFPNLLPRINHFLHARLYRKWITTASFQPRLKTKLFNPTNSRADTLPT